VLLAQRPANRPPIARTGPDQVLYAGLDGTAAVTLNGSNSSDPDGDPLSYTWAWVAGGAACLSNGVSPTLNLPAGVYSIQLMVNDTQMDSQPASVLVTVLQRPTIVLTAQTKGTMAFTWDAIAGTKYQVQYTTNLTAPVMWTTLQTVTIVTNPTVIIDYGSADQPERFYQTVPQ